MYLQQPQTILNTNLSKFNLSKPPSYRYSTSLLCSKVEYILSVPECPKYILIMCTIRFFTFKEFNSEIIMIPSNTKVNNICKGMDTGGGYPSWTYYASTRTKTRFFWVIFNVISLFNLLLIFSTLFCLLIYVLLSFTPSNFSWFTLYLCYAANKQQESISRKKVKQQNRTTSAQYLFQM